MTTKVTRYNVSDKDYSVSVQRNKLWVNKFPSMYGCEGLNMYRYSLR